MDFRLVLVDDCSPDETVARAKALTSGDERVEIHVNSRRLGLLENTRRAYALALRHRPELFALASDHDLWAPTWLERLVEAIDAAPAAVVAYPLSERIDDDGHTIAGPWRFETRGIADPAVRMRRAVRHMRAGEMVYGLFRTSALGRAPFYRDLVYPDRLLFAELALRGEFVQVPEVLWRRRILALPSVARQRRALWPDGAPARTRLPYWVAHAGVVARTHGLRRGLVDFLPAAILFELRATAGRILYAAARRTARLIAATPAGRPLVEGRIPLPSRAREAFVRLAQSPFNDARPPT